MSLMQAGDIGDMTGTNVGSVALQQIRELIADLLGI